MNENELDKFFGDLPKEDQQLADVFGEQPESKPAVEASEGDGEKSSEEPRKNRRHRRLEMALERKDAELEELRSRMSSLETNRGRESSTDVDSRLLRLYGDTPEGHEAARLHMELLMDARKEARDEALQELETAQQRAAQEQRQFEEFIDSELESIEDEHNVDVTSDAPAARKARREFLELVQKLSPKDSEGNISAYADFQEVWDIYQANRTKPEAATRAKEIAARTMQKSGTGTTPPAAPTPGFRGWMKDLNING